MPKMKYVSARDTFCTLGHCLHYGTAENNLNSTKILQDKPIDQTEYSRLQFRAPDTIRRHILQ